MTGDPSTGNPAGYPTTGGATAGGSNAAGSPESAVTPRPEQLARPVSNRMLAGVAAGIARHLGVDVTAVRVVFAVLTVIGGAGIPIYLAGWLLIPDESSGTSIADGLIQSWHDRRR
jgi:phage shock protein C